MKIAYSLVLACLLMQAMLDARADASCPDEVVAAVANHAGVKTEDAPVAATCKRWPYDQKTLLSALAFGTGKDDEKLLVVAMIDARTGRVTSSYQKKVGEDSLVQFGEGSLLIDTAPYQLAKDARAFGLRFRSDAIGASCPDAVWDDEMTLFVPTGKALRPVLQGLAMKASLATKGCFGKIASDLEYDEARLSLGLATTSSHGLADLVVTARINDGGKTERYTLRYDGKQYQGTGRPPWWLMMSSPGG